MNKRIEVIFKWFTSSIVLVLMTGFMVKAEEVEEKGFRCYENGQEIFRSESFDINDFDASSRGLKQVSVQDVPEKKARIYIFEPGPIICSLKTGEAS